MGREAAKTKEKAVKFRRKTFRLGWWKKKSNKATGRRILSRRQMIICSRCQMNLIIPNDEQSGYESNVSNWSQWTTTIIWNRSDLLMKLFNEIRHLSYQNSKFIHTTKFLFFAHIDQLNKVEMKVQKLFSNTLTAYKQSVICSSYPNLFNNSVTAYKVLFGWLLQITVWANFMCRSHYSSNSILAKSDYLKEGDGAFPT